MNVDPALAGCDARSIVDVEVRRVGVPLVAPRRAAHGVESDREVVLVGVRTDDGRTGWGECAALARPTYTGEWVDGAWMAITRLLVPALLERRDPGVVGHPMAAAAVECATVDVALRAAGRSLAGALSATVTRVASTAVIGLGSQDATIEQVGRALDRGHRSVKLKVAPGRVAPVQAVRSTWPDLLLAVDANGSFDRRADADDLSLLDGLELAYVEQPLPALDLVGHGELRRTWETPIALDESVAHVGSLRAAAALGAIDVLNVKPARLGGLVATAAVLDAMVDVGVEGFCGGMYELGIGRAAALAVAASPLLSGRPTDLGPSSSYVERDLVDPHLLGDDGCIAVPSGPGIGRVPDLARLDELTRDRISLHP